MAWKPDYTTLSLLKAHLRINDTADDTALSACITAASRAIDYECNRQFGSASQVRYYTFDCAYTIDGCYALKIDDVQTSVGLTIAYDVTNTAAWSQATTLGTDWTLWPYNAPSEAQPWTHLLQRDAGLYPFPTARQGVKVTATFGWSAVPAVVGSASLIQAARFFVRRDAAFGVAGSPDLGNELRLQERVDPDVAVMLKSVKRRWGAV